MALALYPNLSFVVCISEYIQIDLLHPVIPASWHIQRDYMYLVPPYHHLHLRHHQVLGATLLVLGKVHVMPKLVHASRQLLGSKYYDQHHSC